MRLQEADQIVPLIAGGESRESNLCTLLAAHHKTKTAADVAERKRLNHLGLKRRKPPIRSRGLDKTEPQRRASRPLEKWKGFD